MIAVFTSRDILMSNGPGDNGNRVLCKGSLVTGFKATNIVTGNGNFPLPGGYQMDSQTDDLKCCLPIPIGQTPTPTSNRYLKSCSITRYPLYNCTALIHICRTVRADIAAHPFECFFFLASVGVCMFRTLPPDSKSLRLRYKGHSVTVSQQTTRNVCCQIY